MGLTSGNVSLIPSPPGQVTVNQTSFDALVVSTTFWLKYKFPAPVECIHISRMCDGKRDCQFGDDEGVCHRCDELHCEHNCQFTKRTFDGGYEPSCQCPPGDVLMEDKRSCRVANYCKTDKGRVCQHFCREKNQTAICYCAPGYNLIEDKVSCVSLKHDGTILLAAGPEVCSKEKDHKCF